jgi:ketosteroid isomerase-like protein
VIDESTQLVQEAIEAWNRGDANSLVEMADPEIELTPVVNASVAGRPYRGHDGVRRFVRDYREAFEDFELHSGEVHRFGEFSVWTGMVRAKGRDSGVELDQPFATVSELRGEKTIRFRSYLDPEEATRDAEDGSI